ncbi:transposase family protein [Streptomyces sp. NPDC056227]|uniref:transposase family protein n=1 Tax=Streptomyces sp. NPDC056227 TaxID=3345753 RepID=UPI0035E1A4F4
MDGTETQARRPRANRPGRRAFISGKRRQNTIKTTTISDHQGRALFSGAQRPGRMPDRTALRTEGIAEQLCRHPTVRAEVDEGCRGLANEFPEQVSAPPRKPRDLDNAPLSERYGWREMRRRQSSRRICVEHANAEHRHWRWIPAASRCGSRRTRPAPCDDGC